VLKSRIKSAFCAEKTSNKIQITIVLRFFFEFFTCSIAFYSYFFAKKSKFKTGLVILFVRKL